MTYAEKRAALVMVMTAFTVACFFTNAELEGEESVLMDLGGFATYAVEENPVAVLLDQVTELRGEMDSRDALVLEAAQQMDGFGNPNE